MSLSGAQQGIFQPLKNAAWLAYCQRNPAVHPNNGPALDAWYRKELVRACRVRSTKDIREARQFDALCLHFATLAGDDRQIHYWSRCEERRILHIIDLMLAALDLRREYAHGIAKHMGFFHGEVDSIQELPEKHLWRMTIALNGHCKRQLGRDVWQEICHKFQLPAIEHVERMLDPVCDPAAEIAVGVPV